MKHSPAPWKFWNSHTIETTELMTVAPNGDRAGWDFKSINIGDANDLVVCNVDAMTTNHRCDNFNQWEANARLICAAPEMLAIIQGMQKSLIEAAEHIAHIGGAPEASRACMTAADCSAYLEKYGITDLKMQTNFAQTA